MRGSPAVLCLTAACLLYGSEVVAADLYVSPSGGAGANCSLATPCREIRRALQLVGAGDTVLVADGSYLGFDVDDLHGSAGSPITIRAQGSGAVVVPTSDRSDNRDTIFVTFSSHIVIDGLRSFGANRAAVRVDQSPNVTVRNGVFGDNSRWGIFTDFSDDLLLENNECYGSQVEHGIYVSNSGDRPVVRGNRVHDNNASGIQLNADLSAGGDGIISGALIEGNLIWNNGVAGGAAINLDGVQDSIVRNNLLYSNHATGIVNYAGDGAAGPGGMQILNNSIDQAADGRWALLIHDVTRPNTVRNNVLYNRHAFRGGIEYGSPADANLTDSDYNVLDRVSTDAGGSVIALGSWQGAGHEPNSRALTLAQLFIAPAAGDFRPPAGSPAIDAGLTLAGVATDIDGKPRPKGTAGDVGAYESTPLDFVDVPPPHLYYRFVINLASNGVTAGCATDPARYCPDSPVTREQMAIFLLRGDEGPGYVPPACTTPPFSDVPCSRLPYAPWIAELSRRGITAGCGGGEYCPDSPVTREQMAIFLLRSIEGSAWLPPTCTTAPFLDVACGGIYSNWIQELARRGITAGCGGGNFCPEQAVTRGQMAVFLVRTFGLALR